MPAIVSPVSSVLILRGATAAAFPALNGSVVFENQVPFRLRSLRSAPGVLTQRVLRAHGSGLLTFAYQLALTETDFDAELQLSVSLGAFGVLPTFADFRADLSGVTPPATFSSSAMEGCVFKFSYGLTVGKNSRFCFLSTQAREFSESGGTVKLTTGLKSITLDVASATGMAPANWSKPPDPLSRSSENSAEVQPAVTDSSETNA